MALFGKRKDTVPTHRPPQAATPQYASASSLPQPSTDWTDVANVKAEWQGSNLQTKEDGLLGWSNGTRLFTEGPIPPLLACNRVITLVDQIPSEPAFMAEFGHDSPVSRSQSSASRAGNHPNLVAMTR